MANLEISTTQNVNLNYKVASIGERILAFIIDLFLFFLYFYLIELFSTMMNRSFFDDWTIFGVQQLLLLPVMFYSLYMPILFEGRTIGKMALGIKAVKLDGSPAHWSDHMIRWLLRIADIWIISGVVGLFFILFTDNRQRLGDLASKMVVISTKKELTIRHTILEEITEEYDPMFHQVTQLSDKDVRLIKETFQVAIRSKDYKTLHQLRNRVETVLETSSEMYDKEFIERILRDYNFYTQNM